MTSPLYAVYGASGHGRETMPIARAWCAERGLPPDRLVFVDDAPPAALVNGHRVLTWEAFLRQRATTRHAAIAVADGRVRERLALRCEAHGVSLWSLQAANAVLMDDVRLGAGALISPFAALTCNIRIGRCFHANVYSHVSHDCVIGDYVTFAPGVRCNGNVVIGDHAYIGAGAVIRQGRPGAPLVIGAGAVVGMGAVVTRDVPPGAVVAGNPARPLPRKDSAC